MCLVMETGSVEEIAGLRRDRGVTVLSTRPARDEAEVQLIISGKISCMSRCHRNIDTVASKTQLRENLPQSDDASSSQVQLCYPRGLDIGSSLIHSIRSRLSSPSSGLQSAAPPTSRRWFYLVTMLLLLIALPCHVSASESNYAKVPLSRTDVTKSRDGFRIFRGLGPATYVADRSSHSGGDPVVLPRSARLLRTTIPPLDFQKMTFLEKWGGVLLVSGRNYIYMINASQPST
uniref:Uncharacterized protein n=1 Tax=Ciona savignyi TaxID=51511 RepID=H2YNM6_CIOSA